MGRRIVHCGYSSNWIGRGCKQAGSFFPCQSLPLSHLGDASTFYKRHPSADTHSLGTTKRQNTERHKYKKTEKGTKKGGKKKKNWTYSTTDSCCCCTRDWTDRRANELASRWHTVHPVVMGQGSWIRTKTLLEDRRWFSSKLPWIIWTPSGASLSSSLHSTKSTRPLLAPGCPSCKGFSHCC